MQTTTFKNKEEVLDALVSPTDVILDVGFWGQGVSIENPNWPHRLLLNRANNVYGLDLTFDASLLDNPERYFLMSAESFSIPITFDLIFAGDLIEHLSNPGLFLQTAKTHLKPGGRIILTTPNAFNLFTIAGKLMHFEPVVNPDHTCYFNYKTIRVLLEKNDLQLAHLGYMYTLGVKHKESVKKKILNMLYRFASWFTPKYYETMVIVATPRG